LFSRLLQIRAQYAQCTHLELKTVGYEFLCCKGGLGHVADAKLRGTYKDVEQLMRQNATHGAAECCFGR